MVLLPNVPFVDGQIVSPEMLYLAYNQVYDDLTQYLGHQPRLMDDSLSNATGQLKDRVKTITDGLKVSVVSGLTLSYLSGVVRLPNGDLLSIAGGQIVAPDNSVTFVYVDSSGVIAVGTPTVVRALLAKVTTVSGTVTALQDYRFNGIIEVAPVNSAIKSFGGNSSTDFTATAGLTLGQGEYYFRNFTVPAGITLTISSYAKISCSGSVNIAGTVNITPMARGSVPMGINIVANAIVGGSPGQGLGVSGTVYPFGAQPYGTGGNGCLAYSDTLSWFYSSPGGGGGGSLLIEAAGAILVTGSIFANGGNGSQGGINDASNWVSGASGSRRGLVSGSGGGSGGLIRLSSTVSVVCSATSVLQVKGGIGGDGLSANVGSTLGLIAGGYGGSGGYIVLASPNNNTSGATLDLTGGLSGIPAGFATNPSANVYTASNWYISSAGGSFAGVAGGVNSTGVSPITYTRGASGSGQMILLSFIPLG
jgi:hypothetical protein